MFTLPEHSRSRDARGARRLKGLKPARRLKGLGSYRVDQGVPVGFHSQTNTQATRAAPPAPSPFPGESRAEPVEVGEAHDAFKSFPFPAGLREGEI